MRCLQVWERVQPAPAHDLGQPLPCHSAFCISLPPTPSTASQRLRRGKVLREEGGGRVGRCPGPHRSALPLGQTTVSGQVFSWMQDARRY